MLRAVLAVLLAVALLGVAAPGLADGRRAATTIAVADTLDRIERGAARLAETGVPVPGPGPRRVLTLRLPAASLGQAGVERLVVRDRRVRWRSGAGHTDTRRLDAPLGTDADGVVLGAGRQRVVLELEADGGPVTLRRFMPEEGTTAGHASVVH